MKNPSWSFCYAVVVTWPKSSLIKTTSRVEKNCRCNITFSQCCKTDKRQYIISIHYWNKRINYTDVLSHNRFASHCLLHFEWMECMEWVETRTVHNVLLKFWSVRINSNETHKFPRFRGRSERPFNSFATRVHDPYFDYKYAERAPCSRWWRISLVSAYVLHLHSHTIACLGSKCLNTLPSPLFFFFKSKLPLYAYSENKVADEESE